ncbi:hypothetical protein, partial [Mycobacterium noviomagense]
MVAHAEWFIPTWYPSEQFTPYESGVCTKSGGGTDAVGVFGELVGVEYESDGYADGSDEVVGALVGVLVLWVARVIAITATMTIMAAATPTPAQILAGEAGWRCGGGGA